MKKINWFVIGYALVMFILTVITTALLFDSRYHLSFDLINIITIGSILGLGYLVSIGLFVIEYSDRKRNNIANNLYEGTGND